MNTIFPKEILNNTKQVHLFTQSVKSKIIYTTILLVILIAFISTPFISLDIYSSSSGILKSEKERHPIIPLYSGIITDFKIKENQIVEQFDTLVMIDATTYHERKNLTQQKLEEIHLYIKDLQYLTLKPNQITVKNLQHFKYQKEYLQFQEKIHELNTRYNKAKKDFDRQSKLYNKDVISQVEYQENRYALDLITSDLAYFKKQQIQYWQTDLTQQLTLEKEFLSSLVQINKEIEQHIIKAPINGTIQNLIGVGNGSIVTVGNPICEISPETEIIAECYVFPSDIGLIKPHNKVKFQITSYDYNQWGMATGTVKEISTDLLNINDKPVFKVICKIDQKELKLKNGVKGKLKKGMTLQARFFIANRSVFDLLYDKVDDWFNPGNNQ